MLWATHRNASTDCLKPHLGRRSSDAPVVEIEFQIIENTFSGLKCENLEIRLLCHGRSVFNALYIGAFLVVVFSRLRFRCYVFTGIRHHISTSKSE